jgi:hypothetical protein
LKIFPDFGFAFIIPKTFESSHSCFAAPIQIIQYSQPFSHQVLVLRLFCCDQVGTNPTETKTSGMLHLEGGWGKEINNAQDPVERKRGLDKLKGIAYPPAVERMIPVATRPIEMNNSGIRNS